MRKFLIGLITIIILSSINISALDLSASSAIVLEASSGRIVYEKDADTMRPMASTTKIMTALLAIESGKLDRVVEVSPSAIAVEGSSIYLAKGDKLTLESLVYALLLESANDAAAAIAYELGGSIEGFAELMNQKAAELGLSSTHFKNPHGLYDEEHYTTARELALLAANAMQNDTFRSIASTKTHRIDVGDGVRLLHNHNRLLSMYDGAVGVKTGFTKLSGRCLVSAAERDGMMLIAVTLNAPDDWRDHSQMLDLGFETLERRTLIEPYESAIVVPCEGGEASDIIVRNHEGLSLVLPKGSGEITRKIELAQFLWAPIESGERVGRIVFTCDGEILGEVALYAELGTERVKYKKNILEKIFN